MKFNELTFQSMVEASPNALLLINNHGKIVYLNNFTKKLFQYADDELIKRDLKILFPDTFKEKYAALLQSHFTDQVSHQITENEELSAVKKDGTEFPIEMTLNSIITVDGILVLVAIIDITERKKANEQFRLVVESAPNAIILVNSNGKISLINRQTEILFDYSREELYGKKVELLIPDRFKDNHPGHRDLFMTNPQKRAMGAGRDLYAIKKDGTEFPVEIGLNPMTTVDGNFILASIIDITERKKIEEAIQIQSKRIKDKNKELEQFTYIASHDLQEPLNTIISFISLLDNHSKDKLSEIEKKSFHFINKGASRMKELIKGLLDYSRLGKKAEINRVDCNVLVKSVCEDLGSLIKKSNAKIHIRELPVINAFETELRLLFQNIINNAIKFVNPDVAPEILITAKKENANWKFAIKDNGIGIDPKYKDKIFTIFQRLHGRDDYEGTGIGLAHCRKITELHNGDIWVESEIGIGSTFYFTITKNFEKI